MKRCKYADDYDGQASPWCKCYRDGPCDMCLENHQAVCEHPVEWLTQGTEEACVLCGRCDKIICPDIHFLTSKLCKLVRALEQKLDAYP